MWKERKRKTRKFVAKHQECETSSRNLNDIFILKNFFHIAPLLDIIHFMCYHYLA